MPPREKSKPRTGAITIGLTKASRTIVTILCPAPRAASNNTRDNGVTTMAATATATATETEADRLKTAATIGSPAEPTFGPETVNADRALSRRSIPNRRVSLMNVSAKMISMASSMTNARPACPAIASRGVCAIAVNSAAGSAKSITRAFSEPMLRLSMSLVRPATKPRAITRNTGASEATIVLIMMNLAAPDVSFPTAVAPAGHSQLRRGDPKRSDRACSRRDR